jgi:hypothetical protein
VNAEPHVAAVDHRFVDVFERQDICRAVRVLNDRLHRILLSRVTGFVVASRRIAA